MNDSVPPRPPRPPNPPNTFHGSNAAQTGPYSTQYNHYAEPRSKVWMLVTGTAALVVICAAVLAWVKLIGPDGDAARGAGPGAVTSSSSGTSADETERAAGSDSVRWTGGVRITESGPRLDSKPPTLGRENRDLGLALIFPPQVGDSDSLDNERNIAVWPTKGVLPGRQQCAELVSAQGIDQVAVKAGTVLCVRTEERRIARLEVTSASDDFSAGIEAKATVWAEVLKPDPS